MRPALFLLFPLTAILYLPLFLEEFEGPKAYVLIAFASFSAFMVRWREMKNDKVAVALGLFTASAFISTLTSIDRHVSIFGNIRCPNGLLVTASYLVLYLALTQTITRFPDALKLIKTIVVTSGFVAAYGIAQALGFDFQQWNGVLEADGYVRPMSTLGHPNFMAAYLSITLPFAVWLFERARYTLPRAGYALVILLSLTATFLALSRGMWLALIIGMTVYFVRLGRVKNLLKLSAAVGLIAAICLSASPVFRNTALHRYEHMFAPGAARKEYLKGALRIWMRYPILGVGTDAFEIGWQHQRTPYYWEQEPKGSPHRAHNDFLNVLATQGLVGAAAWLALAFAVLMLCLRSKSIFSAPASASIAMFYAQGVTSFIIISTGAMLILCLALLRRENWY